MRGRTESLRLMLPVSLLLPGRPSFSVDFEIDTGFTGALTLPVAAVEALHLPRLHYRAISLADGSETGISVHAASIHWQEREVSIGVLATEKRPLLGTALLNGFELTARFQEGGLVRLSPLQEGVL